MQPGVVLISDPRVVAITPLECGEPLVDLRELPRLRIDRRKWDESAGWHHGRRGLADRLVAAAQALPEGLELLIVEAFRSPVRQAEYWNHYRAELHEHYHGLSEERLYELASRWVAPPDVAPILPKPKRTSRKRPNSPVSMISRSVHTGASARR